MKYAPSALIGRLSRSAGSTTASHNRYGAYLRNRVIPTNPQSSRQTAVRTTFGTFSADYRALTSEQQAGWRALGTQITRTDSLGQQYSLTGLQAFVSVNQNLNLIGQPAVVAAPALALPPALDLVSIVADASAGTITLTTEPEEVPEDTYWVIFGSRPVSAGVQFVPAAAFKFLEAQNPTAGGPFNVGPSWTALFGAMLEGTSLQLRVRAITSAGISGPTQMIRAVVVA